MVRLQLLKAPLDDGSLPEDRWYLPLDLLAVASAAEGAGCEVSILDGGTLSLEAMTAEVGRDTDVVGLTYSALSVRNLALLAELAHRRGARVVLGGQAATASAESLAREAFIDLVVSGDGEPAIREIVTQVKNGQWRAERITNGVASDGNSIVRGPRADLQSEDIGRFSRAAGGLDAETYVGSFAEGNTLKNIQARRASNIFSKRGCNARCSFCARTDKRVRARPALEVATEIDELSRRFDLDYVIDTSDTWITSITWVRDFARERVALRGNGPGMMVFADARHIDNVIPGLLREAGIDNVLLGIESASERVLLRNGKANSKDRIREAVTGLGQAGIRVSLSLVLGLIGEDDASILETRRFVETIVELPQVRCYCNVIMPLPGSHAWKAFLASGPGRKWERALDYDLERVRQEFVSTMTDVTGGADRLLEERDAILAQNDLARLEFAR